MLTSSYKLRENTFKCSHDTLTVFIEEPLNVVLKQDPDLKGLTLIILLLIPIIIMMMMIIMSQCRINQ